MSGATGAASGLGPLAVRASCVEIEGCGVLIRGASGSGKSKLALELIAYGAALVADDVTVLRRDGDALIASAPPPIAGWIEARGFGLLRPQRVSAAARLGGVVALSDAALDGPRLPEPARAVLLNVSLYRYLTHLTFSPAASIFVLFASGKVGSSLNFSAFEEVRSSQGSAAP